MATWYTQRSELVAVWPDAPTGEDLTEVLTAAKEQCLDYLGDLALDEDGQPISDISYRWRRAQLLQARSLVNFQSAGDGDVLGGGTQTVRVYPMDATIRNLLVPRRLTPGVG